MRLHQIPGSQYRGTAERTLQGGSNEEILEWCFARGQKPSEEESKSGCFHRKRGWRDAGSAELRRPEQLGWGERDEIQTGRLDDAEEGESRSADLVFVRQ